ncbi:MAG: FkbM family methyltransferase [Bacteroidales bacterium]|nr:FkbM family methyltransferase [Bacteroidales bacterium]
MPVMVGYDNVEDLPYVDHRGKRLYYPRNTPKGNIEQSYRNLMTEQDVESPHRYVKSYDELKSKILLDVGAAEGIFALEVIDLVEKAYLFECNEKWLEPLNASFKPWKEKTEIVRKYVSNSDFDKSVTIDTYMKGKGYDNIHLKMDIEGAEQEALKGSKALLTKGKSISCSVCTYHKKEDAKAICSFFESLGYTYELSQGYFFAVPYLRKGICRVRKSQ